jgi:alkylhydroperoxidase/carboxymuconolactone decarboxylase family protein YurZ
MILDEHSMRLIAVGASVAANCHECLETNLACAKECGADADEISQAIWVGKMVRKGAASKMDELIASLVKINHIPPSNTGCACES